MIDWDTAAKFLAQAQNEWEVREAMKRIKYNRKAKAKPGQKHCPNCLRPIVIRVYPTGPNDGMSIASCESCGWHQAWDGLLVEGRELNDQWSGGYQESCTVKVVIGPDGQIKEVGR